MASNPKSSENQNEKETATAAFEKCYFTTATKEFELTKHQIECAINDGVLHLLLARNPHHKSGPPARMLYRAEIKQNLNQLKSYPRLSAKENSQKKAKSMAGKVRKKARDEVEFFCETCQSIIRAPSGYPPFEWYCERKISRERTVKLLRRHHIRHQHTNFEEVYRRRFIQNVRSEMEFDEAVTEATAYAQRMVQVKASS